MVNKVLIKLKRAYHRWCLTNAISHHKCKICVYHASTNSYTIQSKVNGYKYHAYVSYNGEIIFQLLEYE